MNNCPMTCTCNGYYNYCAPQVDVHCHQQFDNARTVVVSEQELHRLYNMEKRCWDNEKAYEDLLQRFQFQQVELIKRLEDTINQYHIKIQQLEMIIDMLNMRIQNHDKKYNRLLLKHTTMMKHH